MRSMTTSALPDVLTMYVLTGFSSLVGAVILIWLRGDHRESGPALPLFAAAILALGIGFLSFGARDDVVGWLIGYTGFGVAAVLSWIGSKQLFGHPARPVVAGIALAGYLAALFAMHDATAAQAIGRITLSSLFVAGFMGLAALEAHRSRWIGQLRSARLFRALLIAFGAIVMARLAAFVANAILLHSDGSAPPSLLLVLSAVVFGSLPFAITVSVLSFANSQLSARL